MIVTDSVPNRTVRFLPPTSGQVWHSSVIGGSMFTAISLPLWFKYFFDSSLPVERCRHDCSGLRECGGHQCGAANHAIRSDRSADHEFDESVFHGVIVPLPPVNV
jgi:hypothetical protein